jgi:hypothetical protein
MNALVLLKKVRYCYFHLVLFFVLDCLFHVLLYVLFVFALFLLWLVACAPGDIVRGDGSCVDPRQQYDKIFDCADGTDERDCGKFGYWKRMLENIKKTEFDTCDST